MNGLARLYHRTITARVRCIIAGLTGILGLGRLGVLSSGPVTTLPAELYGMALLFVSLALFLTAGIWRSRVLGRVVAGLTFCVLVGLAWDFWLTIRGSTTALMLVWLAVWVLWEAVAEHDC